MTGKRLLLTAALLAVPLSIVFGVASTGVASAAAAPGFHAITPARAMDSRDSTPLSGGETRAVHIVGVGGVPTTATAVALNVTVIDPDINGFLTVYPAGSPQPGTSNLNYVTGQTVANMVTVGLGTGGDVLVTNTSVGSTNSIVDVAGWYDGGFHAVAPVRLMDTRNNLGGTAIGATETHTLIVRGTGGVPAGATAVALNVTVVNPTKAGFLTVFPAGATRPEASNLNFVAGQIVPNMVTVGLGAAGDIALYNAAGTTDIIVDIEGWFDGALHPLTPSRIMDTRSGQCLVKMGPGETRFVAVAGQGGVPTSAAAVSLNVTAVAPTAPTFLTLWPSDKPQPNASNLNPMAGIVPNMATVGLGHDGRLAIFNAAGVVDVLIDVDGWYDGDAPGAVSSICETMGTPPSLITNGAEAAPASDYPIHAAKYGQRSDDVANIQHRLYDLGYWVADFDGQYGYVTYQAVMAFQKYMGLPRTGNLDDRGAFLLSMQSYRPVATSRTGDLTEVDKAKQLLFVVRGGKVVWTINTSTGSDIPYTEVNQRDGGTIDGDAHTPEGRFRIYQAYGDGWEKGQLGELYRPRYFNGGVAVHGAPNIPGYPASHGCVRVSTTFMDWVWDNNILPMGSNVWVHS
jgi:peptidoglycan hydrolase-like protein with peptidoglycan-binding domain